MPVFVNRLNEIIKIMNTVYTEICIGWRWNYNRVGFLRFLNNELNERVRTNTRLPAVCCFSITIINKYKLCLHLELLSLVLSYVNIQHIMHKTSCKPTLHNNNCMNGWWEGKHFIIIRELTWSSIKIGEEDRIVLYALLNQYKKRDTIT